MTHKIPEITWRLRTLQIRHTHLSKLESQYPEELLTKITTDSKEVMKTQYFNRPYSLFSQHSSSNIYGRSSGGSDSTSITTPSLKSNSDKIKSSKIHLKYRGLIGNEEEALPTA